MNKIYKVIWSKTRNCYVAVSEIAKRNGKDRTSVTGGAAGSRQAARVLCALLLGTYLTAGYSMPVAWGEVTGNGTVNGTFNGTVDGAVIKARSGYVYATGDYASAFGEFTEATGRSAVAWGIGSPVYHVIASGNYSTAFGYITQATKDGATAWGYYSEATGNYSTAWGDHASANTEGSTAWGYKTIAGTDTGLGTGNYATAWGNASKATGNYATAFGDSSTANATNSLAALGATVSAANSAAIGVGATASQADTVALGSGSVANRAAGVTTAKYKGSNTGNAWVSTKNAIAVGDDSTVTRQITGVAAGSADTDAVNVAQLTAAVAGAGGGTAYTAGDGIAIDDTTKAISVKANTDDFEFDSSTKALKIKKNGAVASGNTGLVTGGTVFTEVRPSSDGTYVKKTSTTGANLSALDTQVKTNTDAIGDASSGLTKAVADNAAAIAGKADKATTLTGYGITDAAMLDASNIDVATWGSKLSTGSAIASGNGVLVTGGTVFTEVRPVDGTYVKNNQTTAVNLKALDTQVKANADALADKADSTSVYTKSDVYTKTEADAAFAAIDAANIDAATWGSKLSTGSAIASGNGVLVTGGMVFTEVRPADGTYVKNNQTTAVNLKALDTQVKANADTIATNTTDIGNLKTTVGDAGSGLVKAVADNTTAIAAKADASNVYTKSEMNTKLDAKADKTEIADIKTTADNAKAAADTATAAVAAIGDPEKIASLVTDVDTLKANEGGEVAAPGEVKANKNVTGEKVYNYLNGEALALGANSNRIAMGGGSSATGTQSIAIGFGNTVSGANSGAFGDPNTITGTGSYAVGNNNTIGGNNTFVLGSNVTANVDNAVVLGNKSTAEADAVSVGSAGGERQIKHVADGTDGTDAVNKRQMDAAIDNAVGNNMVEMSHRISDMDSRINKVGAGAAALAALHPIDTDDKFTMGLGYGNYRSAHSAAIGIFYRPTEKIMLSVGGAMGNGENMINAGISFALDKGKGFGTSKAAMARKIAAQDEEIAALKEAHAKENAENKAEIQALKEALARLEAKIGK